LRFRIHQPDEPVDDVVEVKGRYSNLGALLEQLCGLMGSRGRGANDCERSAVKRRELGEVEAFCCRHDRGMDRPERQVPIVGYELRRAAEHGYGRSITPFPPARRA
jgi:hypothetical protein